MTDALHAHYRRALETYIDAKDNTRPARMADAFAADAVLTFSLATPNITFPAQSNGLDALTKTLVSDFGERYTQCRTYYLCDVDALAAQNGVIDALPWLVVMREPSTGALRVGNGTYRWTFDTQADAPLVTAFHIHISRMDVIDDADGALLERLQDGMHYPWLKPSELKERFVALAGAEPALGFALAFSEPVSGTGVG